MRSALETQSDSVSDASGELRFEHYTVLRDEGGKPLELGRGGMGITYKAFDVRLQRPAALKIITAQLLGNESAGARFVQEARAAASVRHQNVATVFHIGESGGKYYYAMELVEGESLGALIRRSNRLETSLALGILEQAAAGLAAIEKQRLVHRDIKPSNIMVSSQDRKLESVKIIDLGLAKRFAEENTLSTVGAFIGTPAYASPEQFAGIAVDIRSDLYSLGVTLWEMLSGKPPFSGSAAELMYQHQHAEPPIEKLKGVPKPIITLLQVLLAKDPNQRFQTPAQLQQALTKVRGATGSNSLLSAKDLRGNSDQITEQSPKRRPRKRALWLIAASLVLVSLLFGAFLFYGTRRFSSNQGSAQAAANKKSIAVLPFESLSDNKSDNYFADGVQDEILNNLAKIGQLKVICRTSVMQYRAEAKRDLRQIADALGVANVLEGTVRRDGNHVRVSTELVDARNYNAIWADSYDRDITDIFTTQSEIAQQVASRLSAQLSPEERKDIEEKPTNNLEAYDLYLQAKHLLEANDREVLPSREKEIYPKIINLLEDATRKDRKFALAYCLIAKVHDILYEDKIDRTPERRALGDAAMNEALRLRSDLPEVHLAAAFHLYICYRDFEKARVQITMATGGLSNNSALLELTAFIDRAQGRWDKATTALERASAVDPLNPGLLDSLASTYWGLRRYRDGEKILNRLIELKPDQPSFRILKAMLSVDERGNVDGARAVCEAVRPSMRDDPWVAQQRVYFALCARDFTGAEKILGESPNKEIFFLGSLVPRQIFVLWVEFLRGNHPTMEEFGAAREQLYRRVEADPSDPFLVTALAYADLALGQQEKSIEEGRRAMELRPISEDAYQGPLIATDVAEIYALTNQRDLALDQLKLLIKKPCWLLSYGNLKTNPGWDPLRKDPHFEALLTALAPQD
jgi:serine/threonine protein kinase/Flp pilus assembly protein TadD